MIFCGTGRPTSTASKEVLLFLEENAWSPRPNTTGRKSSSFSWTPHRRKSSVIRSAFSSGITTFRKTPGMIDISKKIRLRGGDHILNWDHDSPDYHICAPVDSGFVLCRRAIPEKPRLKTRELRIWKPGCFLPSALTGLCRSRRTRRVLIPSRRFLGSSWRGQTWLCSRNATRSCRRATN